MNPLKASDVSSKTSQIKNEAVLYQNLIKRVEFWSSVEERSMLTRFSSALVSADALMLVLFLQMETTLGSEHGDNWSPVA